jgi:hypothetical protein
MAAKKGGIWGALFESDPTADHATPTAPTFGTPTGTPSGPAGPTFGTGPTGPVDLPAGFAPSYTAPAPAVNPALIAEVEQQLASASSAEYTKFGTLLASMNGITDEGLRFRTALQVAQTTLNLNPANIKQVYQARLTELDGIERRFRQQSDAELAKRTTTLETKQAELTRLTAEIQGLDAGRQQVISVSREMQAALDTVRQRAVQEHTTLVQYIGGTA